MWDRQAWVSFLKEELIERREEGCDVDAIASQFANLENAAKEDFLAICKTLEAISPSTEFPYDEPSDLEGIRRRRPHNRHENAFILEDDQLRDKIYGAWLGRCAGCMLGKPVEGWTREKIREYLELVHAYPLTNYIPATVQPPSGFRLREDVCNSVRGKIHFAVRDDDLDYTTLNLQVLERNGVAFTTADICESWLTSMPYALTYTAERAAYRNLVNGLRPPDSATFRNPYREWIGAQIRADVWGYVTPAKPTIAAEFAHRDASLSHVKNGIYGEMFFAAMISAAFATNEIDDIVTAGLSEIPEKSRLAEAVRDVMKWRGECAAWEETWRKVMLKYGTYSPLHTINNATLVLLGLFYGVLDFEKGITISVMSGFDTDCNGATCGSILGAILGSSRLPHKWIDPLNDRLETAVSGVSDSRISDLAQRTFLVQKKLANEL